MAEEHHAPKQIQVRSLNDYLEVMTKAVFQSGMSWKVVENKMPGIKDAMDGLDVVKVADYDERDIERLTGDKRVIRNQRKLVAIRDNARRMLDLDKEHGGFKNYLRSQPDFDSTLKMIRKDFKYMGPFGVFYFLYVVGEEVIDYEEFQRLYK
jgi:3-methyladenine DNA glycosylase Tag